MESGDEYGFSGLASSFGYFTEDITASGKSGSEAVMAISEMYSTVASECVNRTNQYIEIAQREQERYASERPINVEALKRHIDAECVAERLLGQYRECGEKAILGIARISALGLDLNDESLALISTIILLSNSESLELPHILAAVGYLQWFMI